MHYLKNTGFTLIELLIVIMLLGLLAAIALPRYGPVMENARSAEAYSMLAEIVAAEKRYYLENNSYTATITNLDTFEAAPLSDNFTFSIPDTTAETGYTLATKKAGKGTRDYWMCFKTGRKGFDTVVCP